MMPQDWTDPQAESGSLSWHHHFVEPAGRRTGELYLLIPITIIDFVDLVDYVKD